MEYIIRKAIRSYIPKIQANTFNAKKSVTAYRKAMHRRLPYNGGSNEYTYVYIMYPVISMDYNWGLKM